MLQWDFTIYRSTPEEHIKHREQGEHAEMVLASWKAGSEGLDWINRLVDLGNATQRHKGVFMEGAPKCYVLQANHLQALDFEKDVFTPETSNESASPPELFLQRLQECPPGEVLTVYAWDQTRPTNGSNG